MAILNGKPVKAFMYQDHEAHIMVHQAAMQDPKIAQLVSQNPQAKAIQAAALAHMNEHIAFQYRRDIEAQLGVDLPEMDEGIPKELEVELSRLTAKAAQQLLAKNQQEVQQQEAQKQAQDPLVQMQQKELAIKEQEAQTKAAKIAADAMIDAKKLELEQQKIMSNERIAGAQLGAKAAQQQSELEAKQLAEGAKVGMKAVSDERNRETQIMLAKQNRANNQPKGENDGSNARTSDESDRG
jgi:hypothetical protein